MVEKAQPQLEREPMPQWALDQQYEIAKLKKVVWIHVVALFGVMGSFVFGLLGFLPISATTLACGLLVGAVLGIVDVVAMSVSKGWGIFLRVTVYVALFGAILGLFVPNSWFVIGLGVAVGAVLGWEPLTDARGNLSSR